MENRKNILFITIGRFDSIYEKEIYPDLVQCIVNHGHNVTVLRVSSDPNGKKLSGGVVIYNYFLEGIRGNASDLKKGLAYLKFPLKCISFIRKQPKYDICIASTPPVTMAYVFNFLNRKKVPTYLLQKDIFPEDALDLGVLRMHGLIGVIYKFFRYCENRLYKTSSYIGAMSNACVEYLREHNTNIDKYKFEVNPNSLIPRREKISANEKEELRKLYNIPNGKTVFIYGGNIGDAQGTGFIERVMKESICINSAYFLFLGDGKGYCELKAKFSNYQNIEFRGLISPIEYYKLVSCCDVGMIFLSEKLSVPNVPSRMLFYMDNYLPIIAAVDKISDIHRIINDYKIGISVHSSVENIGEYIQGIQTMTIGDIRNKFGIQSKAYLDKYWNCETSVKIIFNHFRD